MSNVIFDSGDYIKQRNLGNTQNGMIYLNAENRNIAIGTIDEFVNFNDILINDNQTLNDLDNYTYTSKFINDNIMQLNSNEYYKVDDAIDVIGNTDENISNGYIKDKMFKLINGITYEGIIDENYDTRGFTIDSIAYIQYIYTVKYPDIINKNFSIVIAFLYMPASKEIQANIYPVLHQQDMQISLQSPYNDSERPFIYKAFWV